MITEPEFYFILCWLEYDSYIFATSQFFLIADKSRLNYSVQTSSFPYFSCWYFLVGESFCGKHLASFLLGQILILFAEILNHFFEIIVLKFRFTIVMVVNCFNNILLFVFFTLFMIRFRWSVEGLRLSICLHSSNRSLLAFLGFLVIALCIFFVIFVLS